MFKPCSKCRTHGGTAVEKRTGQRIKIRHH
jgi:hypothetical protein